MKPYLLQHLLENSASKYPAKIAIQHKTDSLTYQQLLEQSRALGFYLSQLKLKQKPIGIFLDKSLNQVISLLGALYADAFFVIINPALHEKQIAHIIQDCQIETLITAKQTENIPQVKKIIYEEEFPKIIAENLGKTINNTCITDDISNIIYTSGSTGMPKGIVITHRNLIDGANIVSEYLKITENEKILGLLPFNFDYGLNQLNTSLLKGATIVLFQYFMPNSLVKILQDEKITGLAAIPTIWTSVFNSKMAKLDPSIKFPELRYITNSGGKLPLSIVKNIRETFKTTELYLMYGLTEAFRSTYLDPKEVDKRPESMGKAIPNVQVEVVNEQGQPCKPNEIGELIHRGACIARGYWSNPAKTAEVYRPNPLLPKGNEFLETVVYSGDLVYKDAEGFLYFVGRKDNMIKSGGYRVSPTEVEELILSLKGIGDVVVFGLPDDNLGYKIRAIITTSENLDKETILNHCKANAPLYLVPQELFIRETFPKTSSGKLDRPKIKEESLRDHGN